MGFIERFSESEAFNDEVRREVTGKLRDIQDSTGFDVDFNDADYALLSSCLFNAFEWSKTEDGFDYWDGVYCDLFSYETGM